MTRRKANPANAALRATQTAAKHQVRARRGIATHEAVAGGEAGALENLGYAGEVPEQAGDPAPGPEAAGVQRAAKGGGTSARKPRSNAQVPAQAQAGQPSQSAADDATNVTEISATPAAAPPSTSPNAAAPASTSKLARLIALLRQPDGATIEAMGQATGWQAHSVRGAMAGALKRKGLVVVSMKPEGGPRRYRIGDDA